MVALISAAPGHRLRTVWVTGVDDGVDHMVTDEDMSAGMSAGQGIFRAVCGVVVTSDALAAPPGRRCPGCWAVLCPPVRARRVRVPVARRRHRRAGWLRTWVASVFALSAAALCTAVYEPARGWTS